MKYIKLFETFINEAVEISNPIDGKEVVIMPGRFQPFHLGHLAAIENASKQFGKPVIPIQVISKKDKSPFPEKLLQQMGDDVAKNESYIEKFFIYPRGYGLTVIPWFVRFLRDNGYETVGMAAGSDREKAYAGQMKYITSDKTDTVVKDEFEMKIVRNMKNLKSRGHSLYGIAKKLNENKIDTKERGANGWTTQQVKNVLTYHYGKKMLEMSAA